MHAAITGIEYHLPEKTLTTEELSRRFPEWRVEQIDAKTGIRTRHVAADDECASDLAVAAARRLFESGVCSADQIEFLLLCTQSADYALPTTACLLQHRLGMSSASGTLDFNLGCSGFIYGLGLAEGLIASNQASSVLLITAETYSKYIGKDDKSSQTIFGDAAAATLISARGGEPPSIGPFIYGTDGSGGEYLIVPESGTRRMGAPGDLVRHMTPTAAAGGPSPRRLMMNGSRIFEFTLSRIPEAVRTLAQKAGISLASVDLFVFHQANTYMLEELRRILEIPRDKFLIAIRDCGNTISSTIPIALKAAQQEGRLVEGSCVMLVGFGVGLSWGATLVRWTVR